MTIDETTMHAVVGDAVSAKAANCKADRHKVVAFFNIQCTGHLNPMLAFAEQLVSLGWQVHFFAPRIAKDQVAGAGAIWHHYGAEDWDMFEAARRVAKRLDVEPDEMLAKPVMPYAVIPAAVEILPYLIGQMALIRPRFIAFDAACPWAWVLGKTLSIPAVCSMTALPTTAEERDHFSRAWPSARVPTAAADAINKTYGVDLDVNHAYMNYSPYTVIWSSRAWHRGHADLDNATFRYWGSLTSSQAALSAPSKACPVSETLANLRERPLVFVSMGTVVTGHAYHMFGAGLQDFYEKVLAVMASMEGVQFIFAVGKSAPSKVCEDGRVTELCSVPMPANVTAVIKADQLAVLQRARVFVTHCGQNSSSEAALHGVPVVAVPWMHDQIPNGQRFEELGCGLMLCYKKDLGNERDFDMDTSLVTEAGLARCIRRVLEEPSFTESIRAFRAKELEEVGGPFGAKLENLLTWVDAQPAGLFAA
mmetsp:Transcript_21709/g.55331  ORF Transcript_21709/g.55331 Transcript_21709/m.55331 type:complete len:478 (-) Transcript_21709:359-1792(-)